MTAALRPAAPKELADRLNQELTAVRMDNPLSLRRANAACLRGMPFPQLRASRCTDAQQVRPGLQPAAPRGSTTHEARCIRNCAQQMGTSIACVFPAGLPTGGGGASNLGPVSAAGMNWQVDQRQTIAMTTLLSRLSPHCRMLCGRELRPCLNMLATLDGHTPFAGSNKRQNVHNTGGSA